MRQRGVDVRAFGKAAVALAVAAFLVLLASPLVNRVSEDESTYVYDGQRVVQGQVPFRDFFNFSPPGTYYLLAGASCLAPGRPETGGRYLVLCAALLTWLGCYRLLKRCGTGFPAGMVSLLFPLCLYPFAPFAPHHWLGTAALVWAAVVAAALLDRSERGGWLLFGALAGLTGWFMQTEALFCVVLGGMVALVTSGSAGAVARKLATAAAAGLVACALLWGPLVPAGAGAQAWRDVVVWPLTHYSRPGNANDLPVFADLGARLAQLWSPGPGEKVSGPIVAVAGTALYGAVLFGAVVAVAAALWALIRALRRRALPPGPVTVASLLVLVAAGSFVRVNPTWVHLVYVTVPALPFFLAALLGGGAMSRRARHAVIAASAIFLAAGVAYHGRALAGHVPEPWELTDVDRVDRESPLNRSLRTSPLLKPGDRLAVLPSGGNVYLYTYPAAIGYTYLFPLEDQYHDRRDHQVAAEEIVRRRPALILVHKVRYKAFLVPGDPLAHVLTNLYTPVAQTPAVILLAPKGAAGQAPQGAGR